MRLGTWRRTAALLTLVFLIPRGAAFAAPGGSDRAPAPKGDMDGSTLVIAVHSYYPPYEYFDPLDGEFKGFTVEILDALAREMRVKIEYRRLSKVAGLSALVRDEVDGVLGVAYSIERDGYLDFTSPLCTISDVIFVREDNQDIGGIADLVGRTVAVDRNDLIGDVLKRHEDVHLVPTDSYDNALELLERGDVAAFAGSRLTGQYLINTQGLSNVKIVGLPIHQVGYAIAVKDGNNALVSRLEKGLSLIKESGEYDRIFETWFGRDLRRQSPLTRLFLWVFGVSTIVLVGAGLLVNRRLRQRVEKGAKDLEESHTRFQRKADEYVSLFEGANDAIFLIDPANGRFLDINPKAEEITGYSGEELRSMSMRDIHLPIPARGRH